MSKEELLTQVTSDAAEAKRQKINKAYDELKIAFETGVSVEVEVVEQSKGGFKTMYNELPIYLPFIYYANKKELTDEESQATIGRKLKVKIIEFVEDEFGRIVKVNHLRALEDEKWSKIEVGQTVEGKVKLIRPAWLILDIDGIEGFVHISQLSWSKVEDINSFAAVGDVLKGQISKLDKEARKMSITLKGTVNTQFADFFDTHSIGEKITGKVKNITNGGVFLELAPGIDGFLKGNEVSWTKRDVNLNTLFEVSKEYEVELILLDKDNSRIGVSYKRCQPDNWKEIADHYQEGFTYSAVVEFIPTNSRGVEISLNDEIDGFVPKQRMLALYHGNKPTFKRKDVIQVKLVSKDEEKHSLIFESAIKPENPFDSMENNDSRHSRGRISKPDKIHNLTFADLLSATSKKNIRGNK